MPFCQLSDIEEHCQPAAGGLRSVTLYPSEAIATRPFWGATAYSAQEPVLTDSGSSYTIPFDKQSASIISNAQTGPGGDFYLHRITMRLRKNRRAVMEELRKMLHRKFCLITEDFYGVRMWWPDVRLLASREQGERLSSVNAYTFTFERRWEHPGVYLAPAEDPTNIVTIWGDPDANEGWGDGGTEFWGWPG